MNEFIYTLLIPFRGSATTRMTPGIQIGGMVGWRDTPYNFVGQYYMKSQKQR